MKIELPYFFEDCVLGISTEKLRQLYKLTSAVLLEVSMFLHSAGLEQ